MKPQFLELLPPPVRQLVDEIEQMIGSEIVIRKRNAADLEAVTDPSLAICDCFMSDGTMTVNIALPDDQAPKTHVLSHEVMHAHRNICLAMPRLTSVSDTGAASRFAARIENDVEHLFILPEEIAMAPEALDYWHKHYEFRFNEVRPQLNKKGRDPNEQLGLRDTLLRQWLVVTRCLPGWPMLDELQVALRENGFLHEAMKLAERIERDRGNKAEYIGTLLRFAKLNQKDFTLSRFLVTERRIDIEAIPQKR